MMDLLAERLGLSNERMAEIAHKEIVSRLASQILRLLESERAVDTGRAKVRLRDPEALRRIADGEGR